MTKSTSQRKPRLAQAGSRLTEPEVDAALQLIQLSGDSSDSKLGNGGTFNDFEKEEEEEESVGNTTGSTADEISSSMKNIIDENLDDEACPPRQRKFRSILDLYMKTTPLIKKPGKKARKI